MSEEKFTPTDDSELIDVLTEETHNFIWDSVMPLLDLRSDFMYNTYGAEVACFVSTDPHYMTLQALLVSIGINYDEENFREGIEDILKFTFDKKKIRDAAKKENNDG